LVAVLWQQGGPLPNNNDILVV